MRLYSRYPDRLAGSYGAPLMLDCYRAPHGSTVSRPFDITGATARVTVRRLSGETVIAAAAASLSSEATNRVQYVPTNTEERALAAGSYQVFWKITRNGRVMQHGPIDLSVLPSPFGEVAIDPGGSGALVFNVNTNSGLLSLL